MSKLLYYRTGRSYMEELPMALLQGPVEPGQSRRVVSYWMLNDMINDTVLTSGYAEDLGGCALGCVGAAKRVGEEEEVQADSRHAWAVGWATSVSGAHAIYVHTDVHRGVAPGVVMQSSRSWARTLSCKPLDAERGIV